MLTTANIMLTALRLSEGGESDPEDCVRQILRNLSQAKEPAIADMDTLRQSVVEAYLNLAIAGLLDPDQEGRCTLTRRGRHILQEHPLGVDSSVLEEFPEYLISAGRVQEPTRKPRFPQSMSPRRATFWDIRPAFQEEI